MEIHFDSDGTLIFPLITIERTGMQKSLTRKGSFYGLSGDVVEDHRYGRITLARKIVKDKKEEIKKMESDYDKNLIER